jgi:hypothetical protein
MMAKARKIQWAPVSGRSTANGEFRRGDLYWWSRTLERSNDGRYRLKTRVGAALGRDAVSYLGRDQAIDWTFDNATDPITGWNYSREQSIVICDGGDPGPGYRDPDADAE